MAYIYVITNNINGKQYVGKTNYFIEKRFEEHKNDCSKSRDEKRPLYSAMNKYGVENFSIEMLEECSVDIVAEREIYWIEKLNTYKDGYNATLGGDGKQLYNYKELADKYLELGTVKAVCDFYNCDWKTVNTACKENNIQITHQYSQSVINKKKSVIQLGKDTNEILHRFDSIAEAAIYLVENNITSNKSLSGIRSHISSCCRNNRKTAYGYKWKYA